MHGLGELEAVVMDVLWRSPEPSSVREVLEQVSRTRPLAYTTVMTVLDNLHRKGWADRELRNRAFRYRPTSTREDAAARVLRDLLQSTGDPSGILLHFARSASDDESDALRRGLDERPGR